MPVDDCVGADCRVVAFTITAALATDWDGKDSAGGKISGKVRPNQPPNSVYTKMQTAFERALTEYYKPNPKASKCAGDCRCVDTGVVISQTTTAGLKFDTPFAELGPDFRVSGTYTLDIKVTKGQCGPPERIKLARLKFEPLDVPGSIGELVTTKPRRKGGSDKA